MSLKVIGNGTIGEIMHDLLLVELFDVEYYRDLDMRVRGHSTGRFDVAGFYFYFYVCILYFTVCISYWCNYHYYALLCTGQLLVHLVALLSFFIPSVLCSFVLFHCIMWME